MTSPAPFRLPDAVRPSAPTPPVAVQLVPVERLRSREQHFRCEPYRCSLTAGACVDRQAQAVYVHSARHAKVRYVSCQGCALGLEVARHVGEGEARVLAANAERKLAMSPLPKRVK